VNPSGSVRVTTTSHSKARLKLFGFGEDERVVNPGDLLIVSENYLSEVSQIMTSFELTIKGRDMDVFGSQIAKALRLWEQNKEWLTQPSSTRQGRTPSAVEAVGVLDRGRRFAI